MTARERSGAMLRAARRAAGMSLAEVARALGVSVPYVSDVERGRRSITAANLRAFARVVRMHPHDTRRLFVAAGRLPPAVARRTLRSQAAWDYDPAALLEACRRALAGDPSLLAEALEPEPW